MHSVKTIAALLVIPAYSVVSIASPAIGVATGFQDLTINKAHVRGNTTLFEGTSFTTGPDGANMKLDGGTSLRLGSLSKGTIYRDRIELQNGAGEFHSAGSYHIDALSLQVRNGNQGSVARVLISGKHLRVGALTGNLQVLNGQGLLLATVAEGTATEFTPIAEGASASAAGISGASASGGASGAAGSAGAGAGVAGTAAASAGGVLAGHMALVIAGVVVAGAGLASGIAVAATSGPSATLSPTAR